MNRQNTIVYPQLPTWPNMKRLVVAAALVFATLAAAQVDTAWVRTYDGPAHLNDVATAVGVDDSGYVYVAGWTDGANWDQGWLIIKYSPNGDTVWTRRPTDATAYYNSPKDLVVDNRGNVCVTGRFSPNGDYGFLTVEYSRGGALRWSATYDTSSNGDTACASVVVDSSGSVYVTGSGYRNDTMDYVTLKYDTAGVQKWVSRYVSPDGSSGSGALAVCPGGTVVVTGGSTGTAGVSDCLTVKYDATTGDTVWTRRYTGWPYGAAACGVGVAVDSSGNIYVTGTRDSVSTPFFMTLKYDANGSLKWARYFQRNGNATGIALGPSGLVYVTGRGGSGSDIGFVTVMYDSSGDVMWSQDYYPGSNQLSFAMSSDSSGNVYITGGGTFPNGSNPIYTVAYDSEGTCKWVASYSSPWGLGNYSDGLALDRDGNVIVVGAIETASTGWDWVTVKYIQTTGLTGRSPSLGHPERPSAATVVRASIPVTCLGSRGILIDATGCTVASLDPKRPGRVDLRPGVYFAISSQYTSVKKLVVVR
ncbi:MAG TPA: SBBP repeat-containing protein [bacterium]|nr:SBBP repeat-containing protein [bacterium]